MIRQAPVFCTGLSHVAVLFLSMWASSDRRSMKWLLHDGHQRLHAPTQQVIKTANSLRDLQPGRRQVELLGKASRLCAFVSSSSTKARRNLAIRPPLASASQQL